MVGGLESLLMVHAYPTILEKFNWAEKHINDFKSSVDAFRDANRDHVATNTDEQTGDVTYYIKSVPEVPDPIRLILGDAIHSLRSTLDYVCFCDGDRSRKDTR